jgi:hypothetical protein
MSNQRTLVTKLMFFMVICNSLDIGEGGGCVLWGSHRVHSLDWLVLPMCVEEMVFKISPFNCNVSLLLPMLFAVSMSLCFLSGYNACSFRELVHDCMHFFWIWFLFSYRGMVHVHIQEVNSSKMDALWGCICYIVLGNQAIQVGATSKEW